MGWVGGQIGGIEPMLATCRQRARPRATILVANPAGLLGWFTYLPQTPASIEVTRLG